MLRHTTSPSKGQLAGLVLPNSLRRFTKTRDWESATLGSLGYETFLKDHGVTPYSPVDLRTGRALNRETQFLAALSFAMHGIPADASIRVADLGGGPGHYHAVARAAFPRQALDWNIVETPTVAALHSKQSHPSDVTWHSELPAVTSAPIDFVLASAYLNYIEHPYEQLQLLAGASRYIFVTRLPLWPIHVDTPAIQKTGPLRRKGNYPTWFFSEAKFLEFAGSLGSVVMKFEVREDAAFMEGQYLPYTGLLLRMHEEQGT